MLKNELDAFIRKFAVFCEEKFNIQAPEQIDDHVPLEQIFEFDSLVLTMYVIQLEETFNIRVPDEEIIRLGNYSVSRLLNYIENRQAAVKG
ncbi:acyl carrier protein [Cohnella panacarvi]|uniref:acyl carrier protein n=1 Tax=Cohnella panacarvi TaxID=400776 RepID=UPI000479E2C1|nr:phosphopantetheine-binding protein [Cohnella panacarvi]